MIQVQAKLEPRKKIALVAHDNKKDVSAA